MANYVQRSTDEEVGIMLRDMIMIADDDEYQERTGRWNTKFEAKPTMLEAEEWVHRVWTIGGIVAKRKKAERLAKLTKEIAPEMVKSKLITFMIDQQKTITKQYCEALVDELRLTSQYESYKYLRGSTVRFEFYTKGDKFNPHLHFNCETSMKNGQIAQLLKRKFVKDKWNIYRINAVERTADITENYIIDANKTSEKMPSVEKDNEFKKANNIEEVYII